jgi:hypothetical protein
MPHRFCSRSYVLPADQTRSASFCQRGALPWRESWAQRLGACCNFDERAARIFERQQFEFRNTAAGARIAMDEQRALSRLAMDYFLSITQACPTPAVLFLFIPPTDPINNSSQVPCHPPTTSLTKCVSCSKAAIFALCQMLPPVMCCRLKAIIASSSRLRAPPFCKSHARKFPNLLQTKRQVFGMCFFSGICAPYCSHDCSHHQLY